MKNSFKITSIAILVVMVAGGLIAKPRLIDREAEKEEFPDLQVTEKKQEENIINVMKRLNDYGHLVELAQEDRMKNFKAIEEPLEFRHTLKNIKFTPRNTYVRYVKEEPSLFFAGIGNLEEVNALVNEKVQAAKAAGVNATDLQFQNRDGIELTQFGFIKEAVKGGKEETVGSKRKVVSLFYRQLNQQADTERQLQLEMVVMRITDDHLRNKMKDVELIIDPSPLDDNLDDIIVIHRYNTKVPTITVVGAVANTPSYPLRRNFKQKFYVKLLDDYYRLYQLVDNYSTRDGNRYHEEVVEELTDQLYY